MMNILLRCIANRFVVLMYSFTCDYYRYVQFRTHVTFFINFYYNAKYERFLKEVRFKRMPETHSTNKPFYKRTSLSHAEQVFRSCPAWALKLIKRE